jgi:outer membrane protein OmpA-like peptidoglycan-associated protein
LYFDSKDAFLQNTNEIAKEIAQDKKYSIKPLTNFDKIKILSPKGELISLPIDTSTVNLVPLVEEFNSLTFPDIKFNFNEASIVEGTADGLEELAAFLKKNRTVVIEIGGHTDDVGDAKRNRELTERRAINVKKKLLALGVIAERIQTVGYSDSRPVVDNSTEENRNLNRRIEFKLLSY